MNAELKEFVESLAAKGQEEQNKILEAEMEILKQNQIANDVKQNMFDSGLTPGSSKWYDSPEQPPAKKAKRLFEAERAAAAIARSRQTNDDSDDDCDDY